MSSHYIDIQLRPDPELAPHHLLGALYSRLHRALVQLSSHELGISFPAHDERRPSLGAHLRLHGPESGLHTLMGTSWLHGLHDNLRLGNIASAPSDARYRVVSRVQAKSNVERLRRRAMRRHELDVAEAARRIPDSVVERLRLPFVTLGSRSTGQPAFPLFIRHGLLLERPVTGVFNSYGLSQEATIPWF